MNFGKKIKALRLESSMTMQECARRVGVTRSSWVKYERAERIPTYQHMKNIAGFFGKTVQEIFFEDDGKEEK